jgi:hypothetical protein
MVTRFHAVESILLPNWSDAECPWCVERQAVESLAARFVGEGSAIPVKLEQRLLRLRHTPVGLRDDLFIDTSNDWHAPMRKPWELGPTSVFDDEENGQTPMSQTEIFAAVASGIQGLRAGNSLYERPAFPLSLALDPLFWLTGRFYDPALTASILRSCRRHDVRASDLDGPLLAGVRERLDRHGFERLQGELIFAIGRGFLPSPVQEELVPIVLDGAVHDGIRELLVDLLAAG